jgi:hypothetical protein
VRRWAGAEAWWLGGCGEGIERGVGEDKSRHGWPPQSSAPAPASRIMAHARARRGLLLAVAPVILAQPLLLVSVRGPTLFVVSHT